MIDDMGVGVVEALVGWGRLPCIDVVGCSFRCFAIIFVGLTQESCELRPESVMESIVRLCGSETEIPIAECACKFAVELKL